MEWKYNNCSRKEEQENLKIPEKYFKREEHRQE